MRIPGLVLVFVGSVERGIQARARQAGAGSAMQVFRLLPQSHLQSLPISRPKWRKSVQNLITPLVLVRPIPY